MVGLLSQEQLLNRRAQALPGTTESVSLGGPGVQSFEKNMCGIVDMNSGTSKIVRFLLKGCITELEAESETSLEISVLGNGRSDLDYIHLFHINETVPFPVNITYRFENSTEHWRSPKESILVSGLHLSDLSSIL